MRHSFYQFTQTYRGALHPNALHRLAEDILNDTQFPKQSLDYDDVSLYLETNAYYITSMDIFDELWALYENTK